MPTHAAKIAHENHVCKLLDTLIWADPDREGIDSAGNNAEWDRRRKLHREFAEFTESDIREHHIKHRCTGITCCPEGRKSAVERCIDLLIRIWLCFLPAIPAMNRWTHLQGPFSWVAVGMALYHILPSLWVDPTSEDDMPMEANEMLLNPIESKEFKAIIRSRSRKATKLLKNEVNGVDLIVIALMCRPVASLMGHPFRTEALHVEQIILELCGNAASIVQLGSSPA